MDRMQFEEIAADEFAHVPKKFAARLKNVALLIEEDGELLGLYEGVPMTVRDDGLGTLGIMPDTITLFYKPLLKEAVAILDEGRAETALEAVRLAIRETLWHEIAHHFGMDDPQVEGREGEGTNRFKGAA